MRVALALHQSLQHSLILTISAAKTAEFNPDGRERRLFLSFSTLVGSNSSPLVRSMCSGARVHADERRIPAEGLTFDPIVASHRGSSRSSSGARHSRASHAVSRTEAMRSAF